MEKEQETVAFPIVHCLRCGAKYAARSNKLPRTCARCRSPRWNEPKIGHRQARCPIEGCSWVGGFVKEERGLKRLQKHIEKVHGIDALLKLKFGSPEEEETDEVQNDRS